MAEVRNQELIDKSLLRFNGNDGYQLHPLIREFFRVKQTDIENIVEYKKDLCRVMVAIAQQIPDTITLEIIESTTAYIPHLREVGENLMGWVEDEEALGRIYKVKLYGIGQSQTLTDNPCNVRANSVLAGWL